MKRGLELTLELLATTRNEAAAGVLVDALASPHPLVQEGALSALLKRRSPAGLRELVARWHQFDDSFQEIVAEQPAGLSGAVRDAIVSRDLQLCSNGCAIAECTGEYDLIPALINVAEAGEAEHANLAAWTLMHLAQMLHDELASTSDWKERRDPNLFRTHVVSALELATRRYPQHQRKEILTALLILAGPDNATLRRILREPLDRTHTPIIHLLTHSPRPAIMQLVRHFLNDAQAPRSAINVLAHREDDEFVQYLLQELGGELSSTTRRNLKHVTKINWLQHDVARLAALDETQQQAAVQVTVHSGLPRAEKCRVLKELLTHGKPAGRRAAVAALAEFQGVDANRMVLQALRDEDIDAQASALGQLRSRGLPGAMATLIAALDSPHEQLREAARECLREFSFSRYLSAFDGMTDDVRISTGQLVRKVDPQTPQLLAAEMKSPGRSRRLRAIEIAAAMDAIVELETSFHELLADEDHIVRLEAADALARCPSEKTRAALRVAALDGSVAVQHAAQRSLEEIVTARPPSAPPIDLGAINLPDDSGELNLGSWSW